MVLDQSLKNDVAALATAAGRRVGTAGHDVAKSYLLERLAALRLSPYQGNSFELTYHHGNQRFSNLVAVIAGDGTGTPARVDWRTLRQRDRLILCGR